MDVLVLGRMDKKWDFIILKTKGREGKKATINSEEGVPIAKASFFPSNPRTTKSDLFISIPICVS